MKTPNATTPMVHFIVFVMRATSVTVLPVLSLKSTNVSMVVITVHQMRSVLISFTGSNANVMMDIEVMVKIVSTSMNAVKEMFNVEKMRNVRTQRDHMNAFVYLVLY